MEKASLCSSVSRALRRCLAALAFIVLFLLSGAAPAAPAASAAPAADGPRLSVVVKVRPDGALDVFERYERFPSIPYTFASVYTSKAYFFTEEPPVSLLRVKVDGAPFTPEVRQTSGGVTVFDLKAGPGLHTFEVGYRTSRRILFGHGSDSLSWDVLRSHPGTATRVLCIVVPPPGAAFLTKSARLGHETVGHRPVTVRTDPKGHVAFRGDEPCEPDENFVVSVSWPKGAVASDGSDRRLVIYEWSFWAFAAACLALCFLVWYRFGKDGDQGPVVPLFWPPEHEGGDPYSPAEVSYAASEARLSSRGFSALLTGLAQKGALRLSGTGSRKDPYRIQALPGAPRAKLRDEERAVLGVLSESPAVGLSGREAWPLALARDAAYLSVAERFRGFWEMNLPLVLGMHVAVYVAVAAMLVLFSVLYGMHWAASMAVLTVFGGFCWLVYSARTRLSRAVMMWREVGALDLACFLIYCVTAVMVFFFEFLIGSLFSAEELSGFVGWEYIGPWAWLRVLLCLACMARVAWVSRSLRVVFLSPLVALGFAFGFIFAYGLLWASGYFPGVSAVPMCLAMLAPTAFAPFMKRPSAEALPVLSKIKGFAMYLGTTDRERFNTMHPQGREPGEFLRQYPYAVGLGLENAWGAAFAVAIAKTRLGRLSQYS